MPIAAACLGALDAPEDHSDPWRGRTLPIPIAAAAMVIIALVLALLLT